MQGTFLLFCSWTDGVPSSLYKECINELCIPLEILFNKSLKESVIPSICKKAIIIPVYKGGIKSDPVNYRPISLTSVTMKVFERIIRQQIIKFLNDNNLFSNEQHGFRTGRSCLSALLNTFDKMLHGISDSPASCVDMIYLDFSKAFDKVNHGVCTTAQTLKSKNLGMWVSNFLKDRTQCVRIKINTNSIPIPPSGSQFQFQFCLTPTLHIGLFLRGSAFLEYFSFNKTYDQ